MHARSFALALTICSAVGGIAIPGAAEAQTYASGNVDMLRTGWNADAFGLVLDTPVRNPAQCPTPDGYVTDSSQAGYDSFYEIALSAYRIGMPVAVVIDNTPGACVAGRPRIIGINAAPPPPPGPQTMTVVLRVSASFFQFSERRFNDVPVIGTFTGHGTDCSRGVSPIALPGPVSGPDVAGVAGWGQVEGNGHPDSNSDSCVSWVTRFGFDFDLSPFTSVPGVKTIDKAVLRYNETEQPACMTLIYTQGGFMVDADIPCWSGGSGAREDKPDGCLVLRVPGVDLGTVSAAEVWPTTGMSFNKLESRGAWDVTDLMRLRINPGLTPPPEMGGSTLGWGYMLVGTISDTSNLDAEDNTRCSSMIRDIRIELTFTVAPDSGGSFNPPN